jgi:hypothetical protein
VALLLPGHRGMLVLDCAVDDGDAESAGHALLLSAGVASAFDTSAGAAAAAATGGGGGDASDTHDTAGNDVDAVNALVIVIVDDEGSTTFDEARTRAVCDVRANLTSS